jgi:hypothetical protein
VRCHEAQGIRASLVFVFIYALVPPPKLSLHICKSTEPETASRAAGNRDLPFVAQLQIKRARHSQSQSDCECYMDLLVAEGAVQIAELG